MPTPREVFDDPNAHWSFLTAPVDTDFEGQHFDRKEVPRPGPDGRVSSSQMRSFMADDVAKTISAFANENKTGGLLVIGIASNGAVRGIDHLDDSQRSQLTSIAHLLRNQAASNKFHECQDGSGAPKKICFIYTPYTEHAICETTDNTPKAWKRHGSQSLLMDQTQREQLQREKRVVDFELMYCCPFDPIDLDRGVLQELRNSRLADSGHDYNDEELLYQLGAIVRDSSGFYFTKAGFLFFAANPQRMLSRSYIRLLRYESLHMEDRGLPTLDKTFSGAITKQIRDLRTFFRESGFFKTYQRRRADGGFIEEPEYPLIAIDEALVNAVAHRDYAMDLPIECEYYKDAFIVRNAGRILQRDTDVPDQFSLDNIILVSRPRNGKLIEWLREMRDSQGRSFVLALSEGTKRMRKEMERLGLPAPEYLITQAQTQLTLYSKAPEREAALQADQFGDAAGSANLFPLIFHAEDGSALDAADIRTRRKEFLSALRDVLLARGWFIDSYGYSRIIAHRRGSAIQLPSGTSDIVRFYPAYSFELRSYWGQHYLCIDYILEVKNIRSVQKLLHDIQLANLVERKAIAQLDEWIPGRIKAVDQEWTVVFFFDLEEEHRIANSKVIPELPTTLIERILQKQRVQIDLHREIKRHSLAIEKNASRTRFDRTRYIAEDLVNSIFPLHISGMHVTLTPQPVSLYRGTWSGQGLHIRGIREPSVAFNRQQEATDIREGITKYGAYESQPRVIELIPVCTAAQQRNMAALIEQLKIGKFKYRGSERTFGVRFTYRAITTASNPESVVQECARLLREHPEWSQYADFGLLFLVHTPEVGYASDDEQSPYYRIKRMLLEAGVPCQMIDTPSLEQPDMKDLNLALNIIAKCGGTPWVLPDAIPDADFFIGLSYTQSRKSGVQRLMGYANVFNEYGRWLFYSANTQTFAYEERHTYYRTLVHQTLESLSLSQAPNVHFHYSAKFSREDREVILEAARGIRPQGTYSFVWINSHHSVRLYDTRPETDGSLGRGNYIVTSPYQIYLSTTGYNPYRRTLGTPKPLEANIWIERPSNVPLARPDLKALAIQLLSLTKLNWASTDSLSAEPITIKYAGDIAYLTEAFLRLDF